MKTSKLSVLSVIVAVLLLAPVFALPASASANADAFASEVMELVKAERAKANLPVLAIDAANLRAAAVVRANESAVKFDIVAHKRPNGENWNTVLKENGVKRYNGTGETLAAGYDTAAEVVAAWMDNAQDRANILHPGFTHVGVGVYEGEFKLGDDPQNGYIIALLFITESNQRNPDADNAVQAFMRQINGYLVKGLNSILDWFRGLFSKA